eukprot:c13923_g1_i1.p1 GENE.c13923_g1_i1~~c13923_g1_i1.p1  ORF type:complete len:358 (+),score=71.77 c13923_g1_i1:31-1104(+)
MKRKQEDKSERKERKRAKKEERSKKKKSKGDETDQIDVPAVREQLMELLNEKLSNAEIKEVFTRIDSGQVLNVQSMINTRLRDTFVNLFKALNLVPQPGLPYAYRRAQDSKTKYIDFVELHLNGVQKTLASSGPAPSSSSASVRPAPGPTLPRLPNYDAGDSDKSPEREDEEQAGYNSDDGPAPFMGTDEQLKEMEREQLDTAFKHMEDRRDNVQSSDKPVREEWMTTLPKFGMLSGIENKPRVFRKHDRVLEQDKSWGMTPQEKAEADKKIVTKKPLVGTEKAPQSKKVVVNRSGRPLLEQHLEQHQTRQGEEEPNHPWQPFDRERDLQISKKMSTNDVRKLAKSVDLTSKFVSGR